MATSSNPLNTFENLLPGLKTYVVSLVSIGFGVYQAIHMANWQDGTVPVLIGSLSATFRAAIEELKNLGAPKL